MSNKPAAVAQLRPGESWAWNNEDYADLVWLDSTSKPTEAEIEAKLSEINSAEPMRLLRVERDRLLAETDWWAVSDRTMSAEQSAYRQALRDLPANTPDPSNPTWPSKPGA